MAESKMPAKIWATCNGMSTRLPDGHRQFIGGWSEDKDRPRAEPFIRADIAEQLAEALRSAIRVADEAREEWDKAPSGMKAGKLLIALSEPSLKYRADITAIHAALSSWEAASHTPLRARQAADTEGAK